MAVHRDKRRSAPPPIIGVAPSELVPSGFIDVTDAEDLELSDADRAFLDYVAEAAVELYFERLAHRRRGP